MRAALEQMARDNSVRSILARQRETMAFIAAQGLRPVPATQELYAAEAALRRQLPTTPEQAAEVQQAASEVTANLRKRKVVERIRAAFNEVDVAGLTPWGVLVLVTWLMLRMASEPGQTPSNDLVVISIVIAIAAIILRKD